MKDYIEERAVEIASYIIETKATVRQTAKKFGISKSTVHKDDGVIIRIGASCEISVADFPWRAEETLQALVS